MYTTSAKSNTLVLRRRLLRWWLEDHAKLHVHLLHTVEEHVRWKPVPQSHIHELVKHFRIDGQLTPNLSFYMNAMSVYGPIEEWDTSQIEDMSNLFGCRECMYDHRFFNFNSDISQWDVSNVQNMNRMFQGAKSFNQDLSSWNTSNVVNMSHMFNHAMKFNQSLSTWNTCNVRCMDYMFANCAAFNGDLSTWNMSNVQSMCGMFARAIVFNQPVGDWDLRNCVHMEELFFNAPAFNQPLATWDVSNVRFMNKMFAHTVQFNQPLDTWDVSCVTTTWMMFAHTTAFNQPLNRWNVSHVQDMSVMFSHSIAFNQPLNSWNTARVVNMSRMFASSKAFNNAVGPWRMFDCSGMFMWSNAFNQPLDGWKLTPCANVLAIFHGALAFNQSVRWLFPRLDTIHDDVNTFYNPPFQCAFALEDGPHYDALEARNYPWMKAHTPYDRFVAAKFHRKYPRHTAVLRGMINQNHPLGAPFTWRQVQCLCTQHEVQLHPGAFMEEHRAQTHWLLSSLDAPTCPERYILCMALYHQIHNKKIFDIFSTDDTLGWNNYRDMEQFLDASTYDLLHRATDFLL